MATALQHYNKSTASSRAYEKIKENLIDLFCEKYGYDFDYYDYFSECDIYHYEYACIVCEIKIKHFLPRMNDVFASFSVTTTNQLCDYSDEFQRRNYADDITLFPDDCSSVDDDKQTETDDELNAILENANDTEAAYDYAHLYDDEDAVTMTNREYDQLSLCRQNDLSEQSILLQCKLEEFISNDFRSYYDEDKMICFLKENKFIKEDRNNLLYYKILKDEKMTLTVTLNYHNSNKIVIDAYRICPPREDHAYSVIDLNKYTPYPIGEPYFVSETCF